MAQTHHWKFNTATQLEDTIGTLDFSQGYFTVTNIDSAGAINDCLEFVQGFPNGVIETSSNPLPASGSFSICFWWKSNQVAMGPIVTLGYFSLDLNLYTGDWSPWLFRPRLNGNLVFSNLIRNSDPSFNVGPNTFTHYCIAWNGTDWIVSVNGEQGTVVDGTTGTPTELDLYNSANVLRFHADQNYAVFVDDVRIYDTADDGLFAWNNGFGTEEVFDSGAGSAYGPLPTILVSEPEGSAGGGVGASGGLTTIVITPPSGTAEFILDASASGAFVTITITTFSGIAFPEFIATGSLPVITISAPEGSPVITTSIQLDYVACDAEVTWTQNLPITGFSSAIQGQDAISSRITPTIGGSGANIVYFEQRTLAASGTYTYDLMSLTDFLGGALSLSRAYAISITISSGSVSLEPGASNPFQWFFNSSTANISISSPGVFMFAQPESATITSGSKTLKVTNTSGAAAATYKIAILGGR
jgi:hypothetical protein